MHAVFKFYTKFSRFNRFSMTFKIELVASVDNEKVSKFNPDITSYRACTQVVIQYRLITASH